MTSLTGSFRITDAETSLTNTRSVRRRLDFDRPVSRALGLDCLSIPLSAPSGADADDWRFVPIGDSEAKRPVAGAHRAVFDTGVRPRLAPIVDRRSSVPAPDPAARRRARVYSGAEHLADNLRRAPWLTLAGVTRPVPDPELAPSVYGLVFPTVWSSQLALRSRGPGPVRTALHPRRREQVTEALRIPDGVTQCALLPVACTRGTDFRPARRRPMTEVVYADRWRRPLPPEVPGER